MADVSDELSGPRLAELGEPLLAALAEHSPSIRGRCDSIASYAFAASAATGGSRGEAELIRELARLSEAGAIYEPPAALEAEPASLDETERRERSARYERTARLCAGAGIPEQACEWIRRAGERADGGPTPVPRESRIIALARTTRTLLSGSEADPVAALQRIADSGEIDAELAEGLAPLLVPGS